MEIEPIGFLRTCFGSKFAVPRQPGLCPSAWGVLEFTTKFRSKEAVRGLEDFSHLWLVFGFHKTVEEGWRPTVRPPRLGGNERVGVFASRSTYRPNGLGLSLVKLEGIDWESDGEMSPPLLRLGGIDLVDGTPVYDVKPYLPYAEALPEASSGYAGGTIPRVEVKVEDSASADFKTLSERSQRVVFEALELDPRPGGGRDSDGKEFGALLCDRNIRFRFRDGICWITSISQV